MVKEYADLLAAPLAYLFNASIKYGFFLLYAQRIVVPVHKSGGGNKTDMINYRPIALLSVFPNIFKILMKKKFYHFF